MAENFGRSCFIKKGYDEFNQRKSFYYSLYFFLLSYRFRFLLNHWRSRYGSLFLDNRCRLNYFWDRNFLNCRCFFLRKFFEFSELNLFKLLFHLSLRLQFNVPVMLIKFYLLSLILCELTLKFNSALSWQHR